MKLKKEKNDILKTTDFPLLRGIRGGALVLVVFVAFVGCTNRPAAPEKRTFPFVSMPTIYITQQAQAEYLMMHFWDNFDFTDTTWVGSAETITEQALVEFMSVMPFASYNMINSGIQHLLDQADKNQAMYAFFYSKMENYFANPASTFHNNEYYIPVLEHMIVSNSLDERRKARPATILPLLNKNRPGTHAANILFTRISGAKDSLTNIKSPYILVVFYDFDCEECSVLKESIEKSTVIKEMKQKRQLTILAIYPGANMEGWKKSSPQIPASWINGYDHNEEIGREGTYFLRSIPTLFLLNSEYMVILKEPPFQYVEHYLQSIKN